MQVRLNILRQTEKAVQVSVMHNHYQIYRGDIDNERPEWLPKSQIKIEDEKVVWIADWLVREKDIADWGNIVYTAEERAEHRVKYLADIERAKAVGIKGIRKGMRYATIIAKAKEQGIEFAI